jgi:hypothetical protein
MTKLQKKLKKLKKQIVTRYRTLFDFEFQCFKTIPNYTLSITLHPYDSFSCKRNEDDIELKAGFVSLFVSRVFGIGENPVKNGEEVTEIARTLSKSLGIPTAFNLSVSTNPMILNLFSYDYHRASHYLQSSLTNAMISQVATIKEPVKRKAVKKTRKGKK